MSYLALATSYVALPIALFNHGLIWHATISAQKSCCAVKVAFHFISIGLQGGIDSGWGRDCGGGCNRLDMIDGGGGGGKAQLRFHRR